MPAGVCWSVVVPVKRLERAKTRLSGYSADGRAELALGMAADTVAAALACPAVALVLVVTDDARALAALRKLGAEVIADVPSAGLNPALTHGAAEAQRRRPDCGVASLSADLPALTPQVLAEALAPAAMHPRAFVCDEAAVGTTLLTARPGLLLEPAYGASSAGAHAASGAVRLEVPAGSPLRRDVDTSDDLDAALALGVGPATRLLTAG